MKSCMLMLATMVSAWATIAQADTNTPAPPKAAAEASLHALLLGPQSRQHIATALELPDATEASRLRVGPGLRMQAIDGHALTDGQPLAKAILPETSWRFVLLLDGRAVGMATVEHMTNGYAVVDVGARELAERVWALSAQQPGNSPVALLRTREAMMDAVAFGADADDHRFYATVDFTPRASAALRTRPQPMLTADSLAATLREAIAAQTMLTTGSTP